MLVKLLEIEVEVSTYQLVQEIKSRPPLDRVSIFIALLETVWTEDLLEMRRLLEPDIFERFASRVTIFAERAQEVAKEPTP